jgi:hypothetical protein
MPVGEAPPTHEAAPTPAHEKARFPWPHPMPPSRDLLLAAIAAALSMGVVAYLGRELWFAGEAWDLLLDRSLGDVAGLFRPHDGHLELPSAVTNQVLLSAVGFEFWPWHFLPRVFGYAAMTYVMWVVLRRRGSDPAIGWIALGGLLFLGPSGSLGGSDVGFLVVLPALALAASMIDGGGPTRTSDRVVLGGLMVVMVVSDAAGVAAVAGLVVVAVARGHFRAVMPGFLTAAVIYGGWLLWQEPWASRVSALSLETIVTVPEAAWAMLGGAVSQALSLPPSYGPVLAVVLVGALALWGIRGRLATFDYIWVATAALYVVVVALMTPDPAGFDPLAEPHAFALAWLLVPATVPNLRVGVGTPRVVVLSVAAILVVAGSLHALDASLDRAEQIAAESRRHIDAVAGLVLDGEPALGSSLLDVPGDGGPLDGRLTVDAVAGMLAEGWRPDATAEEGDIETDENARGVLRIGAAPGVVGAGCTPVDQGLTVSTVDHPDGLVLTSPEPVAVRLRFTDDLGAGRRIQRVDGPVLIRFPDAATGEVRISPVGPLTTLEACAPAGEG